MSTSTPVAVDFMPGVEREELAAFVQANTDTTGDCWLWTGSTNGGGYGVVWIRGKRVYAHRASLFLARGHLAPTEYACHHCDNPPCVNPAHLYAGDPASNVRDMRERGRARYRAVVGLEHPAATVPPELIVEAVAQYLRGGVSQAAMAARLGVSQTTFGDWVRGRTRPDAGLEGHYIGSNRRPGVPLKPCGTHAAYARHVRNGEKACGDCLAAERAHCLAQRIKRGQRRGVSA